MIGGLRRGDAARAGLPLLALAAGLVLSRLGTSWGQLALGLLAALSIALLSARAHSAAERNIAQAERRRLSAELHDGVATQLASLTWSLSALRRAQVRQPQPDAAPNTLEQELLKIESGAREAQADLRRAVLDLRTPEQALGPWCVRLQQRVTELAASHTAAHQRGCQISVRLGGATERRIAGAVCHQLERAVIEGVYNALRHAACTNIYVDISAGADIQIEVRDDGVGMSQAAEETGGLANLRARASTLHGQLSVLSGAGGTRVRLRVPLAA